MNPEVYVFAKNKDRLAALGVVVVVPDCETLVRLLDKSLTLETAEKSGFPAPRSMVLGNSQQLPEAVGKINPPWVLKSRCSAHGANLILARSHVELEKSFKCLSAIQERPLLQEYIPSRTKRNYYAVVNRDLTVVSLFSPRVRRTRKTGLRTPCAAVESTSDVPFEAEVRTLLRELGAWGGVTVQCLVDKRDGQPKLMEINPRLGHNLCYRTELGINEPLMLLRIAHGQDPGTQPQFAEGLLLLDPLWDILYLLGQALDQSISWLHSKFGRRADEDFPYEQESLGKLLRSFRLEYFGSTRRIISPLNRGFLSDPMPPLCRISRVIIEAIQRRGSPQP